MLLREPNHLDEGLLNYVCIYKMLLRKEKVTAIRKNLYFSNHDAVKIILDHLGS